MPLRRHHHSRVAFAAPAPAAVIQGQTSSVSGLLARYTATKLLEHGDLYSAGRLAVLVQPSLSMQLQQQRGQGDSLVCGRVLEVRGSLSRTITPPVGMGASSKRCVHAGAWPMPKPTWLTQWFPSKQLQHKHARPGDARLTAHRQRYSREVGACVLPAYPTDRQDGFIFHLQHWRQLLVSCLGRMRCAETRKEEAGGRSCAGRLDMHAWCTVARRFTNKWRNSRATCS